MKLTIDSEQRTVTAERDGRETVHSLDSHEAFDLISRAWTAASWSVQYSYSFTWLGRPIIQLPEDMIRLQELIYQVRPDVIVETGIAHGGSLVFSASLCRLMNRGRVIGVDIDIRPHNRDAIERHELFDLITLIEGSSVDPDIVRQVESHIAPGDTVMVMLDSCHEKAHVLAELEAYAPLVTSGSYIIAMDGIMSEVVGAPRTSDDWSWNNPAEAAREFVAHHNDFEIVEPPFPFNEGDVRTRITYSPNGIIRRNA